MDDALLYALPVITTGVTVLFTLAGGAIGRWKSPKRPLDRLDIDDDAFIAAIAAYNDEIARNAPPSADVGSESSTESTPTPQSAEPAKKSASRSASDGKFASQSTAARKSRSVSNGKIRVAGTASARRSIDAIQPAAAERKKPRAKRGKTGRWK